jgi:hypothetical protein
MTLAQLQDALCAQFDAIDRWRDQATNDPRHKPEQVQIAHVRKMSRAYVEFRAALAKLEARPDVR